MLEKQAQKVYVFLLFLTISFFYCLHPCGTIRLHPDTILRIRGVLQRLKCLMVVKVRKPRLKQSCLCSCHLVGDFKISLSLTLSPVYLSPSGKAPNTHINLGPAKVVGLISLPPSSAPQLCISPARLCRIPQVCFLTSGLCTCFSPLPLVLFPVLQIATYISPPSKSWQYWHKAGCPFWVFLGPSFICLSIYDSVWKSAVHLFFQFRAYHFSACSGSPSSCNSSACHSTFARSYRVNEWRMRKPEALILSHTCDHEQII